MFDDGVFSYPIQCRHGLSSLPFRADRFAPRRARALIIVTTPDHITGHVLTHPPGRKRNPAALKTLDSAIRRNGCAGVKRGYLYIDNMTLDGRRERSW